MIVVSGREIRDAIASVCPNYTVSEDADGQLVIHTNMREIADDTYLDLQMTPCDECGVRIDSDIHKEELGMCVECSNKYFDHEGGE